MFLSTYKQFTHCENSSPGPSDVAEELVYLTADSPNTITHLEKGKVYILGGLVDRNAHKGLCFRKATVSLSTTALYETPVMYQNRSLRRFFCFFVGCCFRLHPSEATWQKR